MSKIYKDAPSTLNDFTDGAVFRFFS